ncbi:TetR/AcrR family transcriptional regulator C-terminal ligand-binding domain-containing protein [Paractinoplanes hotanensis]|uniref:TetR/AcrR family transcriptional regulator C-terminal ligand-binding domain-containing protein n=1 Tax=Paractinoplanes hotanensis TaxID=2906497 RepID=A0ABT0XSZ8_9ACTN|nr:TetR/AcrR family transcriptional regulator C-terminal ligand-binding domain-containing protein [Actinoplanes hotanensis]MCM4076901.1 TetR/AcrR family transcriptional regulator C-terminal ligand-binding domain-containing protein [Actinoplanes hotanensis]
MVVLQAERAWGRRSRAEPVPGGLWSGCTGGDRRGEVPDRPRPARVVSLPFDLLRHEMLMTMRPVPDEVITGIVDDIWLPLLTRP